MKPSLQRRAADLGVEIVRQFCHHPRQCTACQWVIANNQQRTLCQAERDLHMIEIGRTHERLTHLGAMPFNLLCVIDTQDARLCNDTTPVKSLLAAFCC